MSTADLTLVDVLTPGGEANIYVVDYVNGSAIAKIYHDPTPNFLATLDFRMRLRNEGICRLLMYRIFDTHVLEVSERLDGITLYDFVHQGQDQRRRLSISEFSYVALQIAETLDTLHRSGMIHGDIKTTNIFVCRDRSRPLVLFDFGGALMLSQAVMKNLAYTPGMSAPEVLEDRISPAADFYSLGIMLFCLLTCKVPFSSSELELTNNEVRAGIIKQRIYNYCKQDAVAHDYLDLFMGLLELAPSQRWAFKEISDFISTYKTKSADKLFELN